MDVNVQPIKYDIASYYIMYIGGKKKKTKHVNGNR